jgi:hypothetical protein
MVLGVALLLTVGNPVAGNDFRTKGPVLVVCPRSPFQIAREKQKPVPREWADVNTVSGNYHVVAFRNRYAVRCAIGG